jgi:pimeloyl-ACP methyl ester carboxylesterase
MSSPGRPKSEYRSAQHGGIPVNITAMWALAIPLSFPLSFPLGVTLALALAGPPAQAQGAGVADEPVAAAAADSALLAGRIVKAPLTLGDHTYTAFWYLPTAEPVGFIQVQHGFSRHCTNQTDTIRRFMDSGLMALCLNADMSGGNPALADTLAAALVAGLTAPDGRPVPDQIVVAGHSAGGHFASRLGWSLDALAPKRLAGAVLFDPVAANASFTTNLQGVSKKGKRPVLAVSANSGPCNAQNNAYPALRRVQADALAAGRDGFVGVQLTDHSTHVDSEGNNTNFLGWTACLQGKPRPFNTSTLRELTSTWARDQVTGSHTHAVYPGGSTINELLAADDAVLID